MVDAAASRLSKDRRTVFVVNDNILKEDQKVKSRAVYVADVGVTPRDRQ